MTERRRITMPCAMADEATSLLVFGFSLDIGEIVTLVTSDGERPARAVRAEHGGYLLEVLH